MLAKFRIVAALTSAAWVVAVVVPPLGGQPPAAAPDDRDNVVIVLDASGSMRQKMKGGRGTRMEAAKKALLAVMDKVQPNTNVGLLVFSGANVQNDWVYPLAPLDKRKLAAAINLPQPDGGTPLGAYLKKGADALLEQRKSQHGFGTFRLLMVSDGEANDPALVDAYLPDVLARGLTVDVIGVDMQAQHALATRVNSYRRADNPEELVAAIADVFGEVGGGAADDAQSAEHFAAISPIPDDMAVAMLGALANAGDHPIGELPPNALGADVPGGFTGPAGVASPAMPVDSGGDVFGSILGGCCVALIAFFVLAGFAVNKIAKSNSPRRRR